MKSEGVGLRRGGGGGAGLARKRHASLGRELTLTILPRSPSPEPPLSHLFSTHHVWENNRIEQFRRIGTQIGGGWRREHVSILPQQLGAGGRIKDGKVALVG